MFLQMPALPPAAAIAVAVDVCVAWEAARGDPFVKQVRRKGSARDAMPLLANTSARLAEKWALGIVGSSIGLENQPVSPKLMTAPSVPVAQTGRLHPLPLGARAMTVQSIAAARASRSQEKARQASLKPMER